MNEELIKVVKDNPNLDIVVMANTQEFTDEYGWILLEKLKIEVADIYKSPDCEALYFDKEEIVEELRGILANEVSIDMSDEEYDKMCEEKSKDYFYKKAIVIWASN